MLSQQNNCSSSSPGGSVAAPSTAMNALGTVYATKRRRRNGKSVKPTPKDTQTKSNPSKRHRERLNGELDTIASLLPFEQNILSKLDRLSILRLSVSYLRTKSCFAAFLASNTGGASDKTDSNGNSDGMAPTTAPSTHPSRHRDLITYDHHVIDGELFLQALNGFLVILDCEGEVFFATHNIETYLGFHQSDIVHQSVYELVHSEDREELQRQLMWNSQLPHDQASLTLQDILHGDQQALERNFTVRFRCLLDNTSGFLRLDIRGRIKVLVGQNRKTEEGAPLALFAVCTPFGPPSLLELPQKEVMFKSKHKLDLSLVSMDQRGKLLLGYNDLELANKGGYDLVHYDDLAYVACAHQELLKTGASGMIAYRLQTRDGDWQWLQTSSRLVYKNSKPDFIICTHRPLMEEEGKDLLGKRTMDFKVSYLDPGLTQSYLCDSELPQLYASRMSRRYKTHLRDFLSTCRSKRSYTAAADPTYNNYNNVYSASATAYATENPASSLYMNPQNLGNLQTLYPTSYIPTDNLFHYRQLGSYYPEYMTTHSYVSNGYMDTTPRSCLSYDAAGLPKTTPSPEQKFYCSSQLDASKYASQYYSANTVLPPLDHKYDLRSTPTGEIRREQTPLLPPSPASTAPPAPSSAPLTPTTEGGKDTSYSNDTRQTVLMWGSSTETAAGAHPHDYDLKKYADSPPSSSTSSGGEGPLSSATSHQYSIASAVAGVQEAIPGAACKWGTPSSIGRHNGGSPHEGASPPGGAGAVGGKVGGYYSASESGGGDVWPPHQYYHYHHAYHTTHSSSAFSPSEPYHPHSPQLNRNHPPPTILCCPSLRNGEEIERGSADIVTSQGSLPSIHLLQAPASLLPSSTPSSVEMVAPAPPPTPVIT